MLNLDPERPPSAPLEAATLLVLRESPPGGALEVFFVRRHAASPFLGGAVVFPGGKLEAADGLVTRTNGVAPRAFGSAQFADNAGHARALAVCACRESLEEGGILPMVRRVSPDSLTAMRRALAAGRPLEALLAQLPDGPELDTFSLHPFARWITPVAETRRFDARFFLTALPEGQHGDPDHHETVAAVWASPERMLGAFFAGDVFLAPPTLRALELLKDARSLADAFAVAARQSLLPICPRFVAGTPPLLAIPGDPLHEEPTPRVDGPTRFVLRDGRFVSESR